MSTPGEPPVVDDAASARLLDLLPQKPPFRFVDVVDACDPGRAVRARWTVTGTEPWLAGHFPGRPTVPGVLLIEALAQAGAIAVLARADPGTLPVFGGIDRARFRRGVEPSERPVEIVLEVSIDHMGGLGGRGRGRATVDGAEVCAGRILFAVAAPRAASPPESL